MAKADPNNTHSIPTIQETADALARYVEENSDAPEKLQRPLEEHLDKFEKTLCTIATDLNLAKPKRKPKRKAEPEREAEAIRIKLVRRIKNRRSSHARFLHYGRFVDENSDLRLGYLIRLTRLEGRGSRSRAAAIEEAAAIKNIVSLT